MIQFNLPRVSKRQKTREFDKDFDLWEDRVKVHRGIFEDMRTRSVWKDHTELNRNTLIDP